VLHYAGFPPARAGSPRSEVTFARRRMRGRHIPAAFVASVLSLRPATGADAVASGGLVAGAGDRSRIPQAIRSWRRRAGVVGTSAAHTESVPACFHPARPARMRVGPGELSSE